MATKWQYPKFREICEHSAFGPRFSSDEYAIDGNVACLRTTDIDSNGRIDLESMPIAKLDLSKFRNHVLQRDDLVITRSGAYLGKAAVFSRFHLPVLPGAFSIRFRLSRVIADPLFFRYYFNSPEGQVAIWSIAAGSVQPNLNIPNLHSLNVPLPPLNEQRAIASLLGSLDDKIDLNRRMNATLEAMARALFQSWFVDFDPVRAKLDGRQPVGLDAATAKLFPHEFRDSALGSIPHGWKAGTVNDAFDFTMGQSPPGDTYNEDGNGLPFYQGRTDFGFRFPTRRVYCTAPTRYAKTGDTLVSVRAPVGDINIANEDCCIGRGVAAVRHKTGATSFTYHAMANLEPDFAKFEAEGTVFGSINKQNFENLRVVIPPPEIVASYEHQAGPLDERIRTLEQQSLTLAAMRDALLPKLLSGELRVGNVEVLG